MGTTRIGGGYGPGAQTSALRQPVEHELTVHLILVTGDPLQKLEPVFASLRGQVAADIRTTVVSGNVDHLDEPNPEGVDVVRFPGESTVQMRQRIPVLAGDAEWILLLEDHNHLHATWIAELRRALDLAPPEVCAVIGGADNRTSTDAWSWANFLNVLGFYWAPIQGRPAEPMFFNVAFRRSILPERSYALGEFEVAVTEQLFAGATSTHPFPIDHVQFRRFPGVLTFHWWNGRLTGAMMREQTTGGFAHVVRHAVRVAGDRAGRLARIIRGHPGAARLPAGTVARVRLLALTHAAGALAGGLFGPGRSAWKLE